MAQMIIPTPEGIQSEARNAFKEKKTLYDKLYGYFQRRRVISLLQSSIDTGDHDKAIELFNNLSQADQAKIMKKMQKTLKRKGVSEVISLLQSSIDTGDRGYYDKAIELFNNLSQADQAKIMKKMQKTLIHYSTGTFFSALKTKAVTIIADFFVDAIKTLPEDESGEKITDPYSPVAEALNRIISLRGVTNCGQENREACILSCTKAMWALNYAPTGLWDERVLDPLTRKFAIPGLLEMPGPEVIDSEDPRKPSSHGWGILRSLIFPSSSRDAVERAEALDVGIAIAKSDSPAKIPFLKRMLCDPDPLVQKAALAAAVYLESVPEELVPTVQALARIRHMKKPAKDLLDLLAPKSVLEAEALTLEPFCKRSGIGRAVFDSMTPAEREDDSLLRNSRSRIARVAGGSGHTEDEVGRLLSQFLSEREAGTNARLDALRSLATLYSGGATHLRPLLVEIGRDRLERAMTTKDERELLDSLKAITILTQAGIVPYTYITLNKILTRLVDSRPAADAFYNLTSAVLNLPNGNGYDDLKWLAGGLDRGRMSKCFAALNYADDRQFEAAHEILDCYESGRDIDRSLLVALALDMLHAVAEPPENAGYLDAEGRLIQITMPETIQISDFLVSEKVPIMAVAHDDDTRPRVWVQQPDGKFKLQPYIELIYGSPEARKNLLPTLHFQDDTVQVSDEKKQEPEAPAAQAEPVIRPAKLDENQVRAHVEKAKAILNRLGELGIDVGFIESRQEVVRKSLELLTHSGDPTSVRTLQTIDHYKSELFEQKLVLMRTAIDVARLQADSAEATGVSATRIVVINDDGYSKPNPEITRHQTREQEILLRKTIADASLTILRAVEVDCSTEDKKLETIHTILDSYADGEVIPRSFMVSLCLDMLDKVQRSRYDEVQKEKAERVLDRLNGFGVNVGFVDRGQNKSRVAASLRVLSNTKKLAFSRALEIIDRNKTDVQEDRLELAILGLNMKPMTEEGKPNKKEANATLTLLRALGVNTYVDSREALRAAKCLVSIRAGDKDQFISANQLIDFYAAGRMDISVAKHVRELMAQRLEEYQDGSEESNDMIAKIKPVLGRLREFDIK